MAGLLVSVRSLEEAKAAFESGAALIDVKEPAHGSLGHANSGVIEEIVAYVAGRRPVSAAMGELQPDHCGTDWQSVPRVASVAGAPEVILLKSVPVPANLEEASACGLVDPHFCKAAASLSVRTLNFRAWSA